MSLIQGQIPSLINGVSQQPHLDRLPSQGDLQENAVSSVSDGLGKRQPTEHIAKLSDHTQDWPLVHFIDRDETEKYVLKIDSESITAYTLTGEEIPVEVSHKDLQYLKCYDYSNERPCSYLKALTLADTTFLLNKTVTTRMDTSKVTDEWGYAAVVWVKAGSYNTEYTVKIEGSTYSFTTSTGTADDDPGSAQTNHIAKKLWLAGIRNLGAEWDLRYREGDNVIFIKRNDGAKFSIEARDAQGNRNIAAVTDMVNKFSDLPGITRNGMIVKVQGDQSSNADDYWVIFRTADESSYGTGLWEECAAPGILKRFDSSTMPHLLVRKQKPDGTKYFEFRGAEVTDTDPGWADRPVGDETSVDIPSFIDKQIGDLFLHRNRLGLLAGQNYVLSRSSDFFNFWSQTVLTIADDDPIDGEAAQARVSRLNHAVPFNEECLFFADRAQLVLKGGDILSPKTFSCLPSSDYESDPFCSPVSVDNVVFFPYRLNAYSGIRELYIDVQSNIKTAISNTDHIPRYIPGSVYQIEASSAHGCLIALSDEDRRALYVYFWKTLNQEKAQSSWSRWVMGTKDKLDYRGEVLGVGYIGKDLYLVVNRNTGDFLEKIAMGSRADDEEDYVTHLDRRVAFDGAEAFYDSTTNETFYTLPYKPDAGRILFATRTSETQKPGTVKSPRLVGYEKPVEPPPVNTTPIVTIAAVDPSAYENPADPGRFVVYRTGDTSSALVVGIAISGTATPTTDYTLDPVVTTSVTIPAGETSTPITVNPVNDGIADSGETVIVTLQPAGSGEYNLGRNSRAVVTIYDSLVNGCPVSALSTGSNALLVLEDIVVPSRTDIHVTDPWDKLVLQEGSIAAPWSYSNGKLSGTVTLTWGGSAWTKINTGIKFTWTDSGGIERDVKVVLLLNNDGEIDLRIANGDDEDVASGFTKAGGTTRLFHGTVEDTCTSYLNEYTGPYDEVDPNDENAGYNGTIRVAQGTYATAPTAPLSLTATAVSSSQIDLTWTDASANEIGFELQRSTDNSTWATIAMLTANTKAFSNQGLASQKLYYYRIRAYNLAGNSAWSNTASATTQGTYSSPQTTILFYNTGQSESDGTMRAGDCGYIDSFWTIDGVSARTTYPWTETVYTLSSKAGTTVKTLTVNTSASQWVNTKSNARWISYSTDSAETAVDTSDKTRKFSTTVIIGGDVDLTKLATTVFSGLLAVADQVTDIYVNGTPTGLTFTGATSWKSFTLPKNLFKHGANGVTFYVKNTGSVSANNPTGLVVQWTETKVNAASSTEGLTPLLSSSVGVPSDPETPPVIEPTSVTTSATSAVVLSDPKDNQWKVAVKGDYRNQPVFFGNVYLFRYRFSNVTLRNPQSGGSVAVTQGRLQLRTMKVHYHDTGFFQVHVTPKARDKQITTFTGRTASVDTKTGDVPLKSGSLRFLVGSKNDQVEIELRNESILPSWFSAAEWEGFYASRIQN